MRSPPARECFARRRARFGGCLLAVGVAGALSQTVASAKTNTRSSYEVLGQRYSILDSAEGYVERGVASWYGPKVHGNVTASGERFDMHALTAAHRTLPIPTDVEVTNLRNGKSIVVRINDRGPFVDRRIIDLSYAAGQSLGLVGAGTELVEVRAIGVSRKVPRSDRVPTAWPRGFVQVGSSSKPANAERMRKRLEASGLRSVVVHEESVGGRRRHAVRVPVTDSVAYARVAGRLRAIGIANAWLAQDTSALRPQDPPTGNALER
jgi:rare lipoprotein A